MRRATVTEDSARGREDAPQRQKDAREAATERDVDELYQRRMRRHWWYRGRRVAVRSIMSRAGVRPGGRVLDYGCGMGNMGPVLARFGTLVGVDISQRALEHGDFRSYSKVICASSPADAAVAAEGPFDTIAALDVVVSVEDDIGLLAGLRSLLTPTGVVVLAVPMGLDLFGEYDRRVGNQRRYSEETTARLGPVDRGSVRHEVVAEQERRHHLLRREVVLEGRVAGLARGRGAGLPGRLEETVELGALDA
jgi:2-polyprenyl-3-methyl-5-hydroxy-6-metoxy-1,4-benzoquinol methylase